MNSTDYRAALASLGLSQAGAAKLLGVNERTSRRWAIGELVIPVPVGRWLRFMAAAEINPELVCELLDPPPEEPEKIVVDDLLVPNPKYQKP